MLPPLQTAAQRFGHGARGPWELLARMRQHPPLWRRYWRIVGVQIAATVVLGAAVFWVGERGADVWRDAFGSEAPLAEIPASLAGPEPTQPAARTEATPEKPARTVAAPPSTPVKGDDEDDDDGDDEEEAAPEKAEPANDIEAEFEAAVKKIEAAPAGERAKLGAEIAAKAKAVAQEAVKNSTRRTRTEPRAPRDPEAERREKIADRTEALAETVTELSEGAHGLVLAPPSDYRKAHRKRFDLEEKFGKIESDVRKLQGLGAAGLTVGQQEKIRMARADLLTARAHERNLSGRLGALLGFLAVVYASLSIAQAGVLAMSRDFHDSLSRELSLLVQVAPEDPPFAPRIRLDVPWVRRKTSRRVQFFMGFMPGTALIWVVGRILPFRNVLVPALTGVWAAYWWLVMTAGQSARAWTPPETTSPPWYIRGWRRLSAKVPFVAWWGHLWERMSQRFYGPAERVEEQTMEFAGLALSRAVALFPLTKLMVRPLFPVAAARLLVEHASTARLAVPVTAAELERAAEVSPDPEARSHSGTWNQTQPAADALRDRR